jgi:hypothetical protein
MLTLKPGCIAVGKEFGQFERDPPGSWRFRVLRYERSDVFVCQLLSSPRAHGDWLIKAGDGAGFLVADRFLEPVRGDSLFDVEETC